jgi:phage-related baseplate assembly protein
MTLAFTDIQLASLPKPQAVEVLSFETILAQCKARLLEIYPECADVLALESEPLVKLLEANAYRELLLRQRYNQEFLDTTLAFATATNLDHIGLTYYQEPRLVLQAADDTANPAVPEILEADDEYRRRLQLKPASYSVAGPKDAYLFHTLSASSNVLDAGITTPYPGTTTVYVLSRAPSGIADAALLSEVLTRLNDAEVRPLCEEVLVQSAGVQTYTATIQLWTYPGVDSALKASHAKAAVEALVGGYQITTGQRGKLYGVGLDHPVSHISAAAHVEGVQRVVVTLPSADVVCNETQAALCTAVTIQWMGVDL